MNVEQYAVKITEPARRQLQEIIRYIAEDLQEKRTAIRMLDTLEKELLSLSRLPNQVALTEEEPWHSAGIRKLPVRIILSTSGSMRSKSRFKSQQLCLAGGIRGLRCKI